MDYTTVPKKDETEKKWCEYQNSRKTSFFAVADQNLFKSILHIVRIFSLCISFTAFGTKTKIGTK